MAVPMAVAQTVNLLYSIVDRVYLGHIAGIGRLAITGVGLCMPVTCILTAFANLCGMGGGPLCSIYRGKGEREEAEAVMGNAFTLLLIFGVSLTVLGWLCRRPLLYLFGASDLTFPYADEYLTIYLLGTLFLMISLGMNPFINAQGFGRVGMTTVVLGAVVNLILDPVFIFLLGLGVRGAAIATVLAQGCSAAWVLRFLTGERGELRLRRGALALGAARVKRMLALGSSGFVMSMTNSLFQAVCNATLQSVGGEVYVGVMTVVNSVREVITMPLQGLANGGQPVLGYNYGAGLYHRVRQGIRFISASSLVLALALWGMVMAFPQALIRLFNDDPALLAAGIPAFRLYFALYFFMVGQFIGQSVSVALNRSKSAVFFSLFRKVGLVVPLTLLLPRVGLGVDGVFLAEPIADVIGGAACYLTMLLTVYRPLGKGSLGAASACRGGPPGSGETE